MKILIMGLPGSRKSTFAEKLTTQLSTSSATEWINADVLRKQFDDWDFSLEGRKRQAERMKTIADEAQLKGIHAVCDFVCPTQELRNIFDADMIVWMNTIKEGRYPDTNDLFEPPTSKEYDFRLTGTDDLDKWSQTIADLIYILE